MKEFNKKQIQEVTDKEEFPFMFIVGVTILGFLVLIFIQNSF
jgi:hypothetical protein